MFNPFETDKQISTIIFTILLFIMSVTALSGKTTATTTKFYATRDVWISAYPGEENYNIGASPKLKLKGIQEMAILDFDLSSLKGKKVENARLFLCNAGNNKLRKIGISTVASPWVEGKSKGYFVDFLGHGATFLNSSYKKQRWVGIESDLTDVTMGMGNTWQHHTELRKEERDWWSVDIAPKLIYALIAGKSYGLLIMDESGQTFANNYVFSKESMQSPYLVITATNTKKNKPRPLEAELFSSVEHAHMEYGAIVFKIPIKEDIFAFDVFINNQEIPLWRIPKPEKRGTVQEIILDWLPPEHEVNIKISAVDELAQRSEPVIVSGYSSKSLKKITSPNYIPEAPIAGEGTKDGALRHFRVWAVPDVTKIDPISGNIISESDIKGFDSKNPVWSEYNKEIAVNGIKGEVIGFQLCIETEPQRFNDLEIKVMPLINNIGNEISSDKFKLYQIYYLKVGEKWYPEIAIPLNDSKFNPKAIQKSIKNQTNQLVYIELNIPSTVVPGHYIGEVIISWKGELKESLKINLDVKNISMPQKLVFVPEFNAYYGPAKTGTTRFLNAHRIAHEHRAVINRVPYSQRGRVHLDMIPEVAYSGNSQISIDWSDYDKRFGPLFDGTAFIDGERKGIPVEKFYLPFFENWPSELATHYKYKFTGKKTQEEISKHALEAPALNEALTSDYKERFVKIIKEFEKHFKEKGWDQTEFQFYLNNKWHHEGASSWWDLDEPMSYDDWMALKFYGLLFRQAIGASPVQFIFRADISRPRWQHDWLNGILNRMYVHNEDFFRRPDRAQQLKEDGQISFSVYGSLNDIDVSNQQTVMWCMNAFIEGADGVLPWQSLGNAKSFISPNRNALIIDAREVVGIDWVVSLRVKALRRCQQNVELLSMLEKKNGYKLEQIRDLFYRYFDMNKLDKHINKMVVIFQNINTNKMENFRKMLIDKLLENS